MNFSCPRTCSLREACRFMAVLRGIGPTQVNSHTVKIRVELRDSVALRAAVEAMGGTWLGNGSHRLYAGLVSGQGFTLAGWQYPLVATESGELSYDDFGGSWGNVADLEKLKAEYAVSKAEQAAVNLGWQTQRTADGLTIYHPSGAGVITINGANADFSGFIGQDCHSARLALGMIGDVQNKPQASEVAAEVHVSQ